MHLILRYFIKKRDRLRLGAQHDLLRSIRNSCFLLVVIFILHSAFMVHYEGLSIEDAVWLTFTTATTVGYGDISASTTQGRIATVFLIYLGGIFILAKVVGDYFDYRFAVREQKTKGHWSWDMNQHIVILNTLFADFFSDINARQYAMTNHNSDQR